MIISNIEDDDISLDKAFSYFELIFPSVYYEKTIFYSILRKYNSNEIKLKLKQLDKNSKLYEYCFDEFIDYTLNNVNNIWIML